MSVLSGLIAAAQRRRQKLRGGAAQHGARAEEKEATMAESTTGTESTSLPPNLAAIVSAAVASAVKPLQTQLGELAANQKVLGDTLAASKPIGAEDVAKTVSELLDKRGQAQASGERRKAFIAEQLKGIPASYHAHLGDDESKWAEKVVEIRSTLKADLAGLGLKLPDVAGEAGPGAGGSAKAPAVTTDLSKLTADQKIALALKARPVPGNVAPADADRKADGGGGGGAGGKAA